MLDPALRWAAVLGSPIGHSLSPVLHRAAYVALGLPWAYSARSVGAGELAAVFAFARADPAFAGFSLTMPLKAEAVPLLDVVTSELGVVNTVVPGPAGLVGHNTDVAGITAALRAVGAAEAPAAPAATQTERALVLGSGGTARAAVEALQLAGHDVTVASRRPDVVTGWGVAWQPFVSVSVTDFAVVVATTPAGVTDGLAHDGWPGSTALVEVLYAPWPTRLAAAAIGAGARVAGGHVVLLGQAVGQVALMTGLPAPEVAMRSALELATGSAETPGEQRP